MSSATDQLCKLFRNSDNIVFFGGAGVSTESGIPDFRSEKGIFAAQDVYGYRPETLISHSFFMNHPELFYRYYRENLIFASAQPNAAHKALARLERAGKLKAVITQNIDGLHQLAGSSNVLELHGSVLRNYCMQCSANYDLSVITEPAGKADEAAIPRCPQCGGMVRPDVVLYEEGLDNQILSDSVSYLSSADILVVGGTSLNVYPAAGLISHYHGNKLVLINKGDTSYDARADLRIKDSIGQVLGEAVNQLGL